jgi:diadenosine tetraphosphate (Ap4A) HIT family hydrolase
MNKCTFCAPESNRVLMGTLRVYAMFSLYPVSPYHTLIVPQRHLEDERLLSKEENEDILFLRKSIASFMEDEHSLGAYNFGVNVGKPAGQTIPHLHYHLIFRVLGDSPDPTGGIRNVLPSKGNYFSGTMDDGREEVMRWTSETKKAMRNRAEKVPITSSDLDV